MPVRVVLGCIWRAYRRVVIVEIDARVVGFIFSWKCDQGTRRSRATSSHLHLTTSDEELSTAIVGCVVNTDMLDPHQVVAAWEAGGQVELVACQSLKPVSGKGFRTAKPSQPTKRWCLSNTLW